MNRQGAQDAKGQDLNRICNVLEGSPLIKSARRYSAFIFIFKSSGNPYCNAAGLSAARSSQIEGCLVEFGRRCNSTAGLRLSLGSTQLCLVGETEQNARRHSPLDLGLCVFELCGVDPVCAASAQCPWLCRGISVGGGGAPDLVEKKFVVAFFATVATAFTKVSSPIPPAIPARVSCSGNAGFSRGRDLRPD